MISLGDAVRDKVTGFMGIVVGTAHWMNGCVRHAVQGTVLKDGVPTAAQWIDDVQLELVKAGKVAVSAAAATGGPRPDPQRAKDATR